MPNRSKAQKKRNTQGRKHASRNRCILPSSSLLGGFGATMSSGDRSLMYQSATGSVTTKHELGLHLVDFFDYQSAQAGAGGVPQYVHNYLWDVDQNLFDTWPTQPGASGTTFCRVRKLEVWVMPQSRGEVPSAAAAGEIPTTNAQQMITVNCQVPGTGANRDPLIANTAYALDTQVTNVLPSINPKWKKVLTCDLQKTFQSGVARPYFAKGGLTPATYSNQVLFSMSIVDPTTGRPYQTGNDDDPAPNIRVKVKLYVDQPINILNRAKFAVFRNEDFALPATGQNGPNFYDTAETYCQLDLSRSQDFLR